MKAGERITEYITKTHDWRGELIKRIRELILEIKPDIEEDWKWNSPVWSYHGMVCSVGAFKKHVSLTFFKGSDLETQTDLFNSARDSKNTRSVIWKEHDPFKKDELEVLLKIAMEHNEKSG